MDHTFIPSPPRILIVKADSVLIAGTRRTPGEPYPVAESMVVSGVGTIIAALFGSPFGTIMYFGHPAYKKSGARMGYRCVCANRSNRNGIFFVCLSAPFLVYLLLCDVATLVPVCVFVWICVFASAFFMYDCMRG